MRLRTRASLDGLTFNGELIVEIKCPVKGRTSTLWKAVAGGEVPPHYDWQIRTPVDGIEGGYGASVRL
ncbi:MAG: hypothetical protein IPK02_16175 [Candidatus Accumulibacter sp.]|uniref:YqaJ viral recombinase domain-containing protein n=1 Tax=Candidatus Accumulibacter affinis TaxID=2954384 RepID=A0A935T975_9PROT|nr:hypothetical protein [Candidatus Accumulibacter affinis]